MNKKNAKFPANSPEAVLTAASTALAAIRKNQCSLDEYLDQSSLDPVLRRRLANLLFAIFRNGNQLTEALLRCCRKAPEISLLELLTAALAMAKLQSGLPPESAVNIAVTTAGKLFDPALKGFVNAVLRKALVLFDQLQIPSLPPEISRVWKKRFSPEEYEYLSGLFTVKPPNTLRLRSNCTPDCGDEKFLTELPLELPWKFFSTDELPELINSSSFRNGVFYIQDPAPGKICAMLQEYHELLPAQVRFLDLCAAPGGKLIMNTELLQNCGHQVTATAVDRSAVRLQLVSENLRRCQLNARIIAADGAVTDLLAGEYFDLVTCDVPCSNSGVFRRRPDALWRWRKADQAPIIALQKSILHNAARLTAPGGLLLYSTCSLEPAENDELIAGFLRKTTSFKLLTSKLFMPNGHCDGTFGALLQKSPEVTA